MPRALLTFLIIRPAALPPTWPGANSVVSTEHGQVPRTRVGRHSVSDVTASRDDGRPVQTSIPWSIPASSPTQPPKDRAARARGIGPIDLVVVNLYPL
jgi:hypothetical protein